MYVFVSRMKKRTWLQMTAIRILARLMRLHKPQGMLAMRSLHRDGFLWIQENWPDKADMVRYRRSSGHQRMFGRMKRLFGQMDRVQFESTNEPDWDEIMARMSNPAVDPPSEGIACD